MIYFAKAEELGLIKIGYSQNPKKRVCEIHLNSPIDIELLEMVNGDKEFIISRGTNLL